MAESLNRDSHGLSDQFSSDWESISPSKASPPGFPTPKYPKRPGLLSRLLNGRFSTESANAVYENVIDDFSEWELDDFVNSESDPKLLLLAAIQQADTTTALKLLDSGNIQFSRDGQLVLIEASAFGNTEIVSRLIRECGIDPSSKQNEAIKNAAKNGHIDTVKLLAQDDRVKEQEKQNVNNLSILGSELYETTIENAAANGHLEIIRFIIEDDEEPSSPERAFQGIMTIKLNGKLAHSPSEALITASYHGQTEIVRYMLENTDALPDAGDNEPIRFAAAQGHLEIVKLLMETGQVDPSLPDNIPLKEAVKHAYEEIAEYLLSFPSVRVEKDLEEALEVASGHPKIAELLQRELGW